MLYLYFKLGMIRRLTRSIGFTRCLSSFGVVDDHFVRSVQAIVGENDVTTSLSSRILHGESASLLYNQFTHKYTLALV